MGSVVRSLGMKFRLYFLPVMWEIINCGVHVSEVEGNSAKNSLHGKHNSSWFGFCLMLCICRVLFLTIFFSFDVIFWGETKWRDR